MATYAFFDHTGDYGVEIEGEGRAEVLATVAPAFLDLLTADPSTVAPATSRELSAEGIDWEDVLVAFGTELLYAFEVDGFLCARFDVDELEEGYVAGTAWGETFDPDRHPIARPMKAVTHHGVVFDERRARLIFDL